MDSPLMGSIVMLAGELLGIALLVLGGIFVHECGHAAAALLCGLQITGVKVGPVHFTPPKSWSFSWSQRGPLAGFVQVQFRKLPVAWARWKIVFFVLGGPLANFCFILIAMPFFRGDTGFANLVMLFTLFSVFVGALQLIPFKTLGRTSDGAKLWVLLFDRKKREELIFLFTLRARIDEIKVLSQAGQPQAALSKMEQLVSTAENIEGLPSVAPLLEKLALAREHLQSQPTEQ